jgi:hypothetical protein
MDEIFKISKSSLQNPAVFKQWQESGYYYSNYAHLKTKNFHKNVGYFLENSNNPCTELEMDERLAKRHRNVSAYSCLTHFAQHVSWMGSIVQGAI